MDKETMRSVLVDCRNSTFCADKQERGEMCILLDRLGEQLGIRGRSFRNDELPRARVPRDDLQRQLGLEVAAADRHGAAPGTMGE